MEEVHFKGAICDWTKDRWTMHKGGINIIVYIINFIILVEHGLHEEGTRSSNKGE